VFTVAFLVLFPDGDPSIGYRRTGHQAERDPPRVALGGGAFDALPDNKKPGAGATGLALSECRFGDLPWIVAPWDTRNRLFHPTEVPHSWVLQISYRANSL
jgi:hypothetical protein